MKRIITLALALVIAFGAVSAANAIDIKVKGQWHFSAGMYDNKNFYSGFDDKPQSDDAFNARQRIRTQIDFVASEQLSGTLMFEIGTIYWGRGNASTGTMGRGAGGTLDADGVNVETKRAFLDWMVPGTDLAVRMGIQLLALPSGTGFGNPVLRSDVAGINANYKFNDTVSATVFWARPFDTAWNDSTRRQWDEVDVFGLMLPIAFDGVKITPWATYASIGGDSDFWRYRVSNEFDGGYAGTGVPNFGSREDAWWVGLGVELNMFDPLSIRFDGMYGYLSGDSDQDWTDYNWANKTNSPKSSGWFFDAIVEYKAGWGTPSIYGWYASGDDVDDVKDGEFGRMPMIGSDMGFGPTMFGTRGGRGYYYDTAITRTGIGTWAIGAKIKDISFIQDLKHLIAFTYYRGTNDKDLGGTSPVAGGPGPNTNNLGVFGEGVYLTTKDAAYEINFVSDYKMYDNLMLTLNFGIAWLDLDGDVWQENAQGYWGDNTSASYTLEFIFEYNF